MEIVLNTKVNGVKPLDFVIREWDDTRLYINLMGYNHPLRKTPDYFFSKEDALEMAHKIIDAYEKKESNEGK